jgi:hypothetical protein
MTLEGVAVWVSIASGLVATLAFAWSAIQYVNVRREQIRQQRFENVQRLVKTFAGFDMSPPSLALQLAAGFEFRFYPEYVLLLETLRAEHAFPGGQHAHQINAELDKSISTIRVGRS